MAEKSDASQSPYAVALELASLIATAEGKLLGIAKSATLDGADRAYILTLYRECLKAVASYNIG